ncbi:MAG: hypothetical protein M0P43_03425 [Arcobacteraceae bacterium]|nr:hypothetical protein [Arcobacteraceae bacterium]
MFGIQEIRKIFILVLFLVTFGVLLDIFLVERPTIMTENKKYAIIDDDQKENENMARILYISLEFNSLIEDINTKNITSEQLPYYKQRIENIKYVIDKDDNDLSWNEGAKQELDAIFLKLQSQSKELSFEELYEKYISIEHKEYCKDKDKDSKAYYLAKDLEKINPELSIKYYKLSLELNTQEVVKWAIFEAIGYQYLILEDFEQSIYWYELATKEEEDIYNCNLGLAYEGASDYKMAFDIFEKGYKLHDSCATHQLGTYYYNGILDGIQDKNKGGQIWLEAYELYKKYDLNYNAEITYNLGIYYMDILKNYEKGRYFFAISALLGDRDSQDILINDSKLYSLDMSKYFLDEIVKNKKFLYQELISRYRIIYDEKAFLDNQNEYEIDNVKVSINENKILLLSTDKDKLRDVIKSMIDIIYIDIYKEEAKNKFEYFGEGTQINIRGLSIDLSKEDKTFVCEIKALK